MTSKTDQIVDQAIDWHLRQGEMDEADWVRFVDWLEADPEHRAAFDRIATLDRYIVAEGHDAALRQVLTPANDVGVPRRGGAVRWIGGGSIVAAAAAAVLMFIQERAPDLYTVATAAGETRTLALADGTRIELSGGTSIVLDNHNPRFAEIKSGEAVFHVKHDADAPFTVHSGDVRVQDLGTVFDVLRDNGRFEVQVAEGSVMFQPERESVRLGAGYALAMREGHRDVHVDRISVDLVGGWRNGRFSFVSEPVSGIARTVERRYGTKLEIDSRLSGKPVTGMISLSGEPRRDIPYIASLVGANWRKDGERWILSPMDAPQP